MVLVIYRTAHIYKRLLQFGLSRYGLPYIIDSTTAFIAHPLDEVRSLGELGEDYNDPVLIKLKQDLTVNRRLGESYFHRNTVTGQWCNEVFSSIKETGWLMGLSVYNGRSLESESYRQSMKQCAIRIISCAAMGLVLLLIFMDQYFFFTRRSQFFAYFLPAVFFGVIVGVISVYNRFPVNGERVAPYISGDSFERIKTNTVAQDFLTKKRIYHKWDPKRIADIKSLDNFLNSYKEQSQKQYKEPVRSIPTGLYIHAIQFVNSYEIRVAGSVWQKFLSRDSKGLKIQKQKYHWDSYPKKGILFPGAQINEYEQADSLSILMEGNKATLYRWRFDVNLPQQLSYALFPFGKNELVLPVWSADLDDNTVLTPDLESYKQLYPDICPGLGNHFEINGWNISSSYYSYSMESYLCDFGNTDMYGLNRFPELVFNISISRKFLDILVCKIVPIFVVWVLLFTILFVRDNDDGFNNVIGCSGLFFVLVFDHINLRQSVLSESIMYLEYCYFFTYLLLLLITVTSFQLETETKIVSSLQWTDSILKRYFWAIITGLMAVTTILRFY